MAVIILIFKDWDHQTDWFDKFWEELPRFYNISQSYVFFLEILCRVTFVCTICHEEKAWQHALHASLQFFIQHLWFYTLWQRIITKIIFTSFFLSSSILHFLTFLRWQQIQMNEFRLFIYDICTSWNNFVLRCETILKQHVFLRLSTTIC